MTTLEQLFLDVVNLSVTASWVIAVVLLLRLILKPVPKKYVCLLWLVVLFRLFCPVTLESEFSLVPQHEEIRYEIVYTTPQIETPSEPVNAVANQTVNPILEQSSAPNPIGSVNPLQVYIFLAAWLWVMGLAVLCGYTLFSWVKMRHWLAEAVPDGGGVYLSDRITSPFVFGIVKPNIYLPFGLEEAERRWVLLHEQSHIARKDFIVKPIFWLAVILHWMNPLVWVAWHCYSRDIELSCDERAIDGLDTEARCQYSETLVHLAVQPKRLHCPVAFGNHSIKQRIRHVLQYKNIAAGLAAVVLMLVVLMMAALGVNPVSTQVQLEQLADQWAQTFADRDGTERYDLMTSNLQQQVDNASAADTSPWWMPVWVDSKDKEKGMFLRGSSPWVESWQLTMSADDSHTVQIKYNMTDSEPQAYCYEETLRFAEEKGQWKVAECQITAELLPEELYEQAEQVQLQIEQGHETWRLDIEQVALAFAHDYLGLSDGELREDRKDTQYRYSSAGQNYIIHLYQPVRPMLRPELGFWAVKAYEEITDPNTYIYHDVSFDLWASFHVEK